MTTAFLVIAAAGCAGEPRPPYADSYTQALERYPGAGPVTQEMLARFVAHFTGLQTPDQPSTETLYAETLYFSDTLLTTENRAALVRHIDTMRRNDAQIDVEVLQTLRQDADVYLVWTMTARFTPIRKPVTSQTIGITHLRFNAQGQVVLHQDFWDSAEGFYQHVPVIGAIIRRIGRRFEDLGSE